MLFIPQEKPLTTKSDFNTLLISFQIESQCFLYFKKSPLPQNPTSKHPLDHFKSSPNAFDTSKESPLPQNPTSKHPLDHFKSSPNAFNTSKKSPLPQNPTSKHPLDHFKSSPNAFDTSKKAPYHKIRLQNIRWIISNRVQMISIPQKKPLTTKSDFKTSVGSFQIESQTFQYLKNSPLPQNPTSKHPLDHFKSSPNVFSTSKIAPYHKIRLQNICFIISNRVPDFSVPQKKPLTTKSDFKTSALSFQIESKCFQYLKNSPLPQNPTSKHLLYHFKSSLRLFSTSKIAPYDKIRLQNIRFIISNRVSDSSVPQKKPLTTKSDFKASVGSFQIESKCFQYLKKSPLR